MIFVEREFNNFLFVSNLIACTIIYVEWILRKLEIFKHF